MKNSNTMLHVSILYTDKGSPIIGVRKDRYFYPDMLGKKFADEEFELQPNYLSDKDYKDFSNLSGMEISKTDTLKNLLNDECKEVSTDKAKDGDLFVRFDKINDKNEPVLHGILKDIKKGLFGNKYTIEQDGKTLVYTEKDFSNGFKIYRKNDE